MNTATKTAPDRDEWAAVFESLPTAAEGWATVKAVAEVVELSPSIVTRRLKALEEGGRVESSSDKAVTGARGRVWRQRADGPRVLGPIETVELPAADVEPDVDTTLALVNTVLDSDDDAVAEAALNALAGDVPAADVEPEVADSRACKQCGADIPRDEAIAGYTQCEKCDPDGDNSVHGPAPEMAAEVPGISPGIVALAADGYFDDDEDEDEDPAPKADARPVVLVASPIAGQPPQRAEVWENDPNLSVVKVVYCDSRTSARVARSRILGPAPTLTEMSDDEANEAFDGLPTHLMVDDEDGDPSPVSPAPTGGDVAAIADWMTSQRTTDPLSAQDARALTDRIRIQVSDLLPLIKEAYTRRAHISLGYESWAEYCDTELRGLRMPLAERQAATAELAAEGMSTRAIAGAIGSSDATVRRDLAATGATDDAPERVTGLDGRSYPARKPKTAADGVPHSPAADGAEGVLIAPDDAPATGDGGGNDTAVPGGNPLLDLRGIAMVWVAAARKGIEYHRPTAIAGDVMGMTACGRSMRTGTQLARDVAESAHDAKPCQRCWQDASPGDTPGQLVPGEADAPQPVDAYQRDPAARLAAVAELAPDYVQPVPEAAIEGEVLPAVGNGPDDPGPVPDPPLDPRTAEAITTNLGGLALAIGNLATLLRDAGPHAGGNLHALRHWRHELDLCIRLAERA